MHKLLSLFFLLTFATGWSQVNRDSILINQRSIDRPLTLYKGQFRISGGYALGIITKNYDDSGDAIKLSDEGLSSVRHSFLVDIKYGILDIVEFQAIIGRQSQAVREQNTLLLSTTTVNSNTVREYSGMEDVYLGLNFRYPFKTKKIDFALLTGMSLPTANKDPDVPSHKLTRTPGAMDVEYRYNYNVGNGVPVMQLGGFFKFRNPKFAYSAQVVHRHGLKDGESYDWAHQIDVNDNFDYRKDPYTFRLADRLSYYVEVEYQPRPWLNLIANVSGFSSTNGWTAEDGATTAVPDASLIALNPGFEILVTPKLWLRQKVQMPVAGKNTESALNFITTISYNFFPF